MKLKYYITSFSLLRKYIHYALLLFGWTSSGGFAGEVTTRIHVSASVGDLTGGACSIKVRDLEFGEYTGKELISDLKFGVNCGKKKVPWQLTFSGGYINSSFDRVLVGSEESGSLQYELLINGSALHDDMVEGIGDMPFEGYITGIVPENQKVPNDNYYDVVEVTLTF